MTESMIESLDVAIFADESCLGNQFQGRANPGGAAGMMEYWTGDRWMRRDYWVSAPDTTNNRMALRSAIVGLGLLRNGPCKVQFVSDSEYLVNGMKELVRRWKARDWTRKGGKIQNLELWKELDQVRDRHRVEWTWVRGHAEHPKNEYADHLATTAAKEGTSSDGLVESGFGAWLDAQRNLHGRYRDYLEAAPPR
jgi:ribonuclease HI